MSAENKQSPLNTSSEEIISRLQGRNRDKSKVIKEQSENIKKLEVKIGQLGGGYEHISQQMEGVKRLWQELVGLDPKTNQDLQRQVKDYLRQFEQIKVNVETLLGQMPKKGLLGSVMDRLRRKDTPEEETKRLEKEKDETNLKKFLLDARDDEGKVWAIVQVMRDKRFASLEEVRPIVRDTFAGLLLVGQKSKEEKKKAEGGITAKVDHLLEKAQRVLDRDQNLATLEYFGAGLLKAAGDPDKIIAYVTSAVAGTSLKLEEVMAKVKEMLPGLVGAENAEEVGQKIETEVSAVLEKQETDKAQDERNKQLKKMALNGAYRWLTNATGVKFATDSILAVGKLLGAEGEGGDIYNYFKGRKEVSAERRGIAEVLVDESRAVEEKMIEIRNRINQSRYINPEEREKLLNQLEEIEAEQDKDSKEAEEERKKQIEEALKMYIQNKVASVTLAKDFFNLALTASGAFFLKTAVYGTAAAVERGRKADLTYKKSALESGQEGDVKERMKFILKDITINATKETLKELWAIKDVGKGVGLGILEKLGLREKILPEKPQRKKVSVALLEFMRGLGTVAMGAGMTGVALSDALPVGENFRHFINEVSEKNVAGVAKAAYDNLVTNSERFITGIHDTATGEIFNKVWNKVSGHEERVIQGLPHGAVEKTAVAIGAAKGAEAVMEQTVKAGTPTGSAHSEAPVAKQAVPAPEAPIPTESASQLEVGGIKASAVGGLDEGAIVTAKGPWTAGMKLGEWFKAHGNVKWSNSEVVAELKRHGYSFDYDEQGNLTGEHHPIVFLKGGGKLVPWVDAQGTGHFEIVDVKSGKGINLHSWEREVEQKPMTEVDFPEAKPAPVVAKEGMLVDRYKDPKLGNVVEIDTGKYGPRLRLNFNDSGKYLGHSGSTERPLDEVIGDIYQQPPEAKAGTAPAELSSQARITRSLDDLDSAYQVLIQSGQGASAEAQGLASEVRSMMGNMAANTKTAMADLYQPEFLQRYYPDVAVAEAGPAPGGVAGAVEVARGGGGGGGVSRAEVEAKVGAPHVYTEKEWQGLSKAGGGGASKAAEAITDGKVVVAVAPEIREEITIGPTDKGIKSGIQAEGIAGKTVGKLSTEPIDSMEKLSGILGEIQKGPESFAHVLPHAEGAMAGKVLQGALDKISQGIEDSAEDPYLQDLFRTNPTNIKETLSELGMYFGLNPEEQMLFEAPNGHVPLFGGNDFIGSAEVTVGTDNGKGLVINYNGREMFFHEPTLNFTTDERGVLMVSSSTASDSFYPAQLEIGQDGKISLAYDRTIDLDGKTRHVVVGLKTGTPVEGSVTPPVSEKSGVPLDSVLETHGQSQMLEKLRGAWHEQLIRRNDIAIDINTRDQLLKQMDEVIKDLSTKIQSGILPQGLDQLFNKQSVSDENALLQQLNQYASENAPGELRIYLAKGGDGNGVAEGAKTVVAIPEGSRAVRVVLDSGKEYFYYSKDRTFSLDNGGNLIVSGGSKGSFRPIFVESIEGKISIERPSS